MKTLVCILMFLFCLNASAVEKINVGPKSKVTHITGYITPDTFNNFALEASLVARLPGDLIVVVNSPGGYEAVGRLMIATIRYIQVHGTKVTCVMDRQASSMAFNLMSFCDKRYYTKGSSSLVHKVEAGARPGVRQTEKELLERAKVVHEADEPYRQMNAVTMRLSLKDYDYFADNETYWTGDKLKEMGYFKDMAVLETK